MNEMIHQGRLVGVSQSLDATSYTSSKFKNYVSLLVSTSRGKVIYSYLAQRNAEVLAYLNPSPPKYQY
jgi:hypothetical protein